MSKTTRQRWPVGSRGSTAGTFCSAGSTIAFRPSSSPWGRPWQSPRSRPMPLTWPDDDYWSSLVFASGSGGYTALQTSEAL